MANDPPHTLPESLRIPFGVHCRWILFHHILNLNFQLFLQCVVSRDVVDDAEVNVSLVRNVIAVFEHLSERVHVVWQRKVLYSVLSVCVSLAIFSIIINQEQQQTIVQEALVFEEVRVFLEHYCNVLSVFQIDRIDRICKVVVFEHIIQVLLITILDVVQEWSLLWLQCSTTLC